MKTMPTLMIDDRRIGTAIACQSRLISSIVSASIEMVNSPTTIVEQWSLMKGVQRDAHRLLLVDGILLGECRQQVGEIEAQRLLRIRERAWVVARRVAPIGIAADVQQ